MHFNLNARVTIDRSECHAVYPTVEYAAQRRTASTAERDPPTLCGDVCIKLALASDPAELTTFRYFRIGR
jgi:hypothetical protein